MGCLIRWTEITADITGSSLKLSKSTRHLNSADITCRDGSGQLTTD